jgi:CDP-diacylglycerol--serine O-phosphatidyltransferase
MLSKRHLANAITITRIIGVFSIFWFTPYRTSFWLFVVLSIYIVVSITDFLDGWVARRLNIESDLGKVLDPLADKILVLTFLPLLEMNVISSFPVFIILSREFAIMALRVVLAKQGHTIAAKLSGKIKTALTLPICGILLARVPVQDVPLPSYFVPFEYLRLWVVSWPMWVISTLIWATVAVTVWSFLDYFWRFIWQSIVLRAGGDEDKARRVVRSFFPSFVTLLNMVCGLFAVFYAINQRFHLAVLLVLLGILLDAVDGTLARRLNAQSPFGAKLDSQADLISFGVAPAAVIFSMTTPVFSLVYVLKALLLSVIYYGCVYFRLRRFGQKGHSAYFQGLPSPVGAAIVVIASISESLSSPLVLAGVVLITSLLMISNIPYPHNVTSRKTFLRYLRAPTFIFLILTMFNLYKVDLPRAYFVYETMFVLLVVYVISPVFSRPKT